MTQTMGRQPARAANSPGAIDPSEPAQTVTAGRLLELAESTLAAAGVRPGHAAAVARALVESNLAGHDSHGVRRLRPYLDFIAAGQVDPAAEPVIAREDGATATVDGARGLGQPAALLATEAASRIAREHGVAAVAVSRCAHVGRLGDYTGQLAADGLAGVALCNADPTVAPLGGRERRLGTNPLSIAVPRGDGEPAIVLDWATASLAEGKLAMAMARGESVPDGIVVDADGRASTDPASFYEGGAILPFGAHKGYGLSVVIELLGGLLSGAGVSSLPGYDESNGTLIIAIDIGRFTSPERFREQAEAFCTLLARTPRAQDSDEVLVPGELETRTKRERERTGIPIPGALWRELLELQAGGRDVDSSNS